MTKERWSTCFLGPLAPCSEASAKQCSQFPAPAEESRKKLVALQNTTCWKDVQRTCARMAQGSYSPCAEVPSIGHAIQRRRTTTVMSAGRYLFSWGGNSLEVNYNGPSITVTHGIYPVFI